MSGTQKVSTFKQKRVRDPFRTRSNQRVDSVRCLCGQFVPTVPRWKKLVEKTLMLASVLSRETWCFCAKMGKSRFRLEGNGLVGGDLGASGSKMDFLVPLSVLLLQPSFHVTTPQVKRL